MKKKKILKELKQINQKMKDDAERLRLEQEREYLAPSWFDIAHFEWQRIKLAWM